jgi:hypothetical protein
MTPMPNQNLTEEQARAVLEYIRHEAAEHGWGTERTGGSGGGQ